MKILFLQLIKWKLLKNYNIASITDKLIPQPATSKSYMNINWTRMSKSSLLTRKLIVQNENFFWWSIRIHDKTKIFLSFFQKLYAYIKLTLADNQSECLGKSMKLTIEWYDTNGLVLQATYKGPTLSCRGYLHRSHWIPPQLKRENRKTCTHKLNSITFRMYS